jgi:hypothetical protein
MMLEVASPLLKVSTSAPTQRSFAGACANAAPARSSEMKLK